MLNCLVETAMSVDGSKLCRTSVYVYKHVHGAKEQQQPSRCQPRRSHVFAFTSSMDAILDLYLAYSMGYTCVSHLLYVDMITPLAEHGV